MMDPWLIDIYKSPATLAYVLVTRRAQEVNATPNAFRGHDTPTGLRSTTATQCSLSA